MVVAARRAGGGAAGGPGGAAACRLPNAARRSPDAPGRAPRARGARGQREKENAPCPLPPRAQFLDLVQRKFYDGMEIQRADGFVVQTGDPDGPATGFVDDSGNVRT
jgi:hypothetical protein